MAANAISQWSNYWQNSREARATGPEEILNDLVRQKYLLGEMSRGSEGGMAVDGGAELSDTIKIGAFSNSRTYRPGEDRNPSRGDSDVRIYAPWRLHETDRPVTEPELATNGSQFEKFKSVERSVSIDLWTDHLNYLDSLLWQQPDSTNMESRTVQPGKAYSIPVFITESGRRPPSWTTTIQAVDPTLYPNYWNQVSTYDSTSLDDPNAGLFSAFDEMLAKVDFATVAGFERYMENDDLRAMKIVTNLDGYNIFQGLLRAANNVTRAGPQDPAYGMPQFKGIPVVYVKALDDALLDQSAGVVGVSEGSYTSQAYPAGKPRFFFINCKYLKMWYHSDHLYREVEKDGGTRNRDVMTHFLESWTNLFCRSRKRQGIVCPA